MNIHESNSDMICIYEHWEMVHCPSKYLIPIKPSKAMSSRDISDFVGLSLHFSLLQSVKIALIFIKLLFIYSKVYSFIRLEDKLHSPKHQAATTFIILGLLTCQTLVIMY